MISVILSCLLLSLGCKKDELNLKADTIISFITDPSMCEVTKVAVVSGADKHSAFSDLIKWSGKWYSVFRVSDGHAYTQDGILKILESDDFSRWKDVRTFKVDSLDLRDPKFNVLKKKLVVTAQGLRFNRDLTANFQKGVIYNIPESDNGNDSGTESPMYINYPSQSYWPWRYTANEGYFYSWVYNTDIGLFRLVKTADFQYFDEIVNFDKLERKPSEATIRFSKNKCYSLIRRAGSTLLGISSVDDISNIHWTELPIIGIGGPDFVFYDPNTIIIGGRDSVNDTYSYENNRTSLYVYKIDVRILYKIVTLPSYGDTGYPSMVLDGKNDLKVIYHSSHEGSSKIYSAHIKLKLR